VGGQVFDLFLGEAEAAVAALIFQQGLNELLFPEVRPQGVGEI